MNQHDQMLREALRLANKALKRWMPVSFDKQAMEQYHQAIAASEQALAAEPEPLVRLTEHQLEQLGCSYAEDFDFANAIMDAMIKNNGGNE